MEHLMLISTPGCGRTMYARSLAEEPSATKFFIAREGATSTLHRMAGLPPRKVLDVPFRAPYHTVSVTGITGSLINGYNVRPGELSLAHGGILLLDEAAEFSRTVLDHVLTVLRTGEVELYGYRGTRVILPAQFRLVISTNPCPCAFRTSNVRKCVCSDQQCKRYMDRLSAFRNHCRVVEEPEIRERVTAIRGKASNE